MHQRLATSFSEHLRGECEIAPPAEARENWHRRALKAEIEFFLSTRKEQQQYGQRAGRRGTCPIVAAVDRNDDWVGGELAWASWREIWMRTGGDEFELKEAAFTFFWGRRSASNPVEDQLFRAEWPQKGHGGKRSGQPHWQVDWPLADGERAVSGIHLAMSGWERNEPPDPIDGWHVSDHFIRYATDVLKDLEMWASRTLAYSLDQIVRFFPRDWG